MNNPHTITLARFPNLANVKAIVDFTIKNKLGNVARLGRNQRYECHLGIPRLASRGVHLH